MMKVFFALPCYGQQLTMHTAAAMNHTVLELAARGIFPGWSYQSACLPHVRNILALSFLQTDATHCFWIDTDLGFKPSDVLKLLKLDVDIAVASYIKKDPTKREHVILKDGKWLDVDALTEPTVIDSAGMGFVCVKREVIEKIAANVSWGGGDIPCIFETGDVHGLHCETEDHAFFKRAKMLGYTAMLDPTIKLVHYGLHAYF